MNLSVDIEVASEGDDVPDPESIIDWLQFAARSQSVKPMLDIISARAPNTDIELSIRIVDRREIRELNQTYRNKDCPTNVLSFSAEIPAGVPICHLGDIVICAHVVNEEAQQQQKSFDAHWAHMTIHGLLHLCGYDHETDADANIMENVESDILNGLHFPNPYSEPISSAANNF